MARAHLLNDGYVNYLPAVLPVLLGKLDIPLALVGSLILALQGLGSILQPFMGWGADRVGGHLFVLTGLGLSMLGASLIGLAPNYGLLLGLLLVTGLRNSIFHIGSSLLSALFLAFFLLAHGLWLWVALGLLGVAVFATEAVTMLVGQDLFPQSHSLGSGIALGVGNTLGAVAVFALGFASSQYGIDAVL